MLDFEMAEQRSLTQTRLKIVNTLKEVYVIPTPQIIMYNSAELFHDTCFSNPAKFILFGRSIGKPKVRSQIN